MVYIVRVNHCEAWNIETRQRLTERTYNCREKGKPKVNVASWIRMVQSEIIFKHYEVGAKCKYKFPCLDDPVRLNSNQVLHETEARVCINPIEKNFTLLNQLTFWNISVKDLGDQTLPWKLRKMQAMAYIQSGTLHIQMKQWYWLVHQKQESPW